jgi:N,N'-diacetyllegionaminate synthase
MAVASTRSQILSIGGRRVGSGCNCFIIAEAGVNHNAEPRLARLMVDAAVEAGADAIKFQTFTAGTLVTESAPKAEYQKQGTDAGESQLEMLRGLELSSAAHREIQDYCRERGITFLSTPFDERAADLLEELEVPAYKISSGDLTNIPLLKHVARKGKPMILSTGMAWLGEVEDAVRAVRDEGCADLVLLQCVSNYPADEEDVNLRAMHTMATAFHAPVGYSDHTTGIEVALAAAALGACVIEKHLTLDRGLPGPDQAASLEPGELSAMVRGIRKVESALGDGRKSPRKSEEPVASVARRSLTAARDMPAGTRLTRDVILARRPGTGLAPNKLESILGRTLRRKIKSGELFNLDMFD